MGLLAKSLWYTSALDLVRMSHLDHCRQECCLVGSVEGMTALHVAAAISDKGTMADLLKQRCPRGQGHVEVMAQPSRQCSCWYSIPVSHLIGYMKTKTTWYITWLLQLRLILWEPHQAVHCTKKRCRKESLEGGDIIFTYDFLVGSSGR